MGPKRRRKIDPYQTWRKRKIKNSEEKNWECENQLSVCLVAFCNDRWWSVSGDLDRERLESDNSMATIKRLKRRRNIDPYKTRRKRKIKNSEEKYWESKNQIEKDWDMKNNQTNKVIVIWKK